MRQPELFRRSSGLACLAGTAVRSWQSCVLSEKQKHWIAVTGSRSGSLVHLLSVDPLRVPCSLSFQSHRNMGFMGKGKSTSAKGYKQGGKSGKWGQQPAPASSMSSSWDPASTWGTAWEGAEEVPEQSRKGRLQAQYHFSKASLRPYCSDTGSALFGDDDKAAVSTGHLKQQLTSANSNLIRHPATGVSCAASSLISGADTLQEIAEDPTVLGLEILHSKWQTDAGKACLEGLRVLDYSKPKQVPRDELANSIEAVETFLRENKKELAEAFGRMAIGASRLYVSSMQGLELLTLMTSPSTWAEKIPDAESESKSLRRWKSEARSKVKMAAALAALLKEKEEFQARYQGESNRAKNVFRKWNQEDDDEEDKDSSDEMMDNKKKGKKEKKEKSKKGKKDGKKDKKKKSKKSKGKAARSSTTRSTSTDESDNTAEKGEAKDAKEDKIKKKTKEVKKAESGSSVDSRVKTGGKPKRTAEKDTKKKTKEQKKDETESSADSTEKAGDKRKRSKASSSSSPEIAKKKAKQSDKVEKDNKESEPASSSAQGVKQIKQAEKAAEKAGADKEVEPGVTEQDGAKSAHGGSRD